ncbi:hypothetical protein HY409_04090 [Candidatus Gottesmanbacteria bacterium]|nr:hypothetical protein [Candidatus Gottesmanbacteria bacterium]
MRHRLNEHVGKQFAILAFPMFEAFEAARQHRFSDTQEGRHAYRTWVDYRIQRIYPFIGREVRDALGRVNRFDYIVPCLVALDDRHAFDPKEIDRELRLALSGGSALIWIKGDEWIRSTDIAVSALMMDAGLTPRRNRVLVAGSGSGYTSAVLEDIGFRAVYAVEKIKELVAISEATLSEKCIVNVKIAVGNAASWIEDKGFFDTILVFAAVSDETVTNTFLEHLHEGGALVAPIGPPDYCHLYQFVRNSGAPTGYTARYLEYVRFTPFVT